MSRATVQHAYLRHQRKKQAETEAENRRPNTFIGSLKRFVRSLFTDERPHEAERDAMDVAEPVSPLSPHRQDRSVPVDHMTHVDPEWEEFQQFKRQKEALRASVTPRASTTSASVYSTPSLQPPTPLIDPYRMVPLMNKSTPRRTAYATPRTSTWAQREVDHSARGFDYDDTRHSIAHVRRTARPAPAEMVGVRTAPVKRSYSHFTHDDEEERYEEERPRKRGRREMRDPSDMQLSAISKKIYESIIAHSPAYKVAAELSRKGVPHTPGSSALKRHRKRREEVSVSLDSDESEGEERRPVHKKRRVSTAEAVNARTGKPTKTASLLLSLHGKKTPKKTAKTTKRTKGKYGIEESEEDEGRMDVDEEEEEGEFVDEIENEEDDEEEEDEEEEEDMEVEEVKPKAPTKVKAVEKKAEEKETSAAAFNMSGKVSEPTISFSFGSKNQESEEKEEEKEAPREAQVAPKVLLTRQESPKLALTTWGDASSSFTSGLTPSGTGFSFAASLTPAAIASKTAPASSPSSKVTSFSFKNTPLDAQPPAPSSPKEKAEEKQDVAKAVEKKEASPPKTGGGFEYTGVNEKSAYMPERESYDTKEFQPVGIVAGPVSTDIAKMTFDMNFGFGDPTVPPVKEESSEENSSWELSDSSDDANKPSKTEAKVATTARQDVDLDVSGEKATEKEPETEKKEEQKAPEEANEWGKPAENSWAKFDVSPTSSASSTVFSFTPVASTGSASTGFSFHLNKVSAAAEEKEAVKSTPAPSAPFNFPSAPPVDEKNLEEAKEKEATKTDEKPVFSFSGFPASQSGTSASTGISFNSATAAQTATASELPPIDPNMGFSFNTATAESSSAPSTGDVFVFSSNKLSASEASAPASVPSFMSVATSTSGGASAFANSFTGGFAKPIPSATPFGFSASSASSIAPSMAFNAPHGGDADMGGDSDMGDMDSQPSYGTPASSVGFSGFAGSGFPAAPSGGASTGFSFNASSGASSGFSGASTGFSFASTSGGFGQSSGGLGGLNQSGAPGFGGQGFPATTGFGGASGQSSQFNSTPAPQFGGGGSDFSDTLGLTPQPQGNVDGRRMVRAMRRAGANR